MNSDWNRLWGDVVLDSVNMTSRDEGNILDHKYKKPTYLDFYYEDIFSFEQ